MTKILATIIIIIIAGVALFLIRGKEDTWICENGQWVKHGVPSAPMPDESCGEENSYIKTITTGLNKAKDVNEKSYTIDMSGQGLTSFPWEVFDQTSAKVLNLSNNKITSLPSEIGKMSKLEELYLDNNLLTGSIVAEIRQMPNLRILSASGNNLTGIPAEIGQLKNLQTIDFSNNNLDTMPNEIVNISSSLKTFNLSGNRYSQSQIDELRQKLPQTDIIY